MLHHVAAKRLAAGRLTVVDATNLQSHARAGLVKVAREHDVLPVAIVLDVPEALAWERTQARADRPFGRHVLDRMHRDLRRSLRQLAKEGFRTVHVLRGPEEIAAATIRYEGLTGMRHSDHRFEWTRAEFADWAGRVAAGHGYRVTFRGVGDPDPELGTPTQLALFVLQEDR